MCTSETAVVPVCLRSVKFFCVRVQCYVVLASSIGFLRKYVIAHSAVLGQISLHHARLFALGQILSCSRTMMSRFVKYQIPQLKDKRTVTCFSDLENLRRSAQNLLIQHEKLKRTNCFNS